MVLPTLKEWTELHVDYIHDGLYDNEPDEKVNRLNQIADNLTVISMVEGNMLFAKEVFQEGRLSLDDRLGVMLRMSTTASDRVKELLSD